MHSTLLAIDIGELLGLLVWVLIISFSILGKIKKSQPKPPLQPARRQRPDGPVQAGQMQPPGRTIETEIEDFLREVRGEKPNRPPVPPQQTAGAKRVITATPLSQVENPGSKSGPVEPGKNFGRDLAAHVEEHIGHDSISTRESGLGDELELVDERVETHLEEVFDKEVGQLAHVEDTDLKVAEGTDAAAWDVPTKEAASADRIREMLRSPGGVRQAFILAEILKRPEF